MRALWLAPALALALTSCSSGDPLAERRADVEAVTLAANDGDADAVREAVEDLLSTIRAQVASGGLDRAEGERLRVIALRIAEQTALLDPEPEPSPTPVETEEPEPEPTEEPEPSEEPPLIVISPASQQSSPTPAPDSAQSSPRPPKKSPQPSPTPAA